MASQDATRVKIIEAARKRFLHYGYGKTTMAELAADCDMSPGNLYRFFPSKLDIAEEIARDASIQTAEELRSILDCPDRTAVERLRDFLFADLRTTYRKLEEDPKIIEMAQIITAERPHFHNEGLKREREVICEILNRGNDSGEFDIDDTEFVAEMIQAATLKFSYPQLFSRLSLEKLETELKGVFALLIQGLAKRPDGVKADVAAALASAAPH